MWDKTIGGTNEDLLKSIAATNDGGYILAGESRSDTSGVKTENCRGGADVWVVKVDSLGMVQWDKTIGGSGNDILMDIIEVQTNHFILSGFSDSGISGDKTEPSRAKMTIGLCS
jgi:hypothetical protein